MTGTSRHIHMLRNRSSTDVSNDPLARARTMVEQNNNRHGTALDWDFQVIDGRYGDRWVVAWVFDTRDMPGEPGWYREAGGETVVCWWAPPHPDCNVCDNYGEIEIFHHSTDGLIGHRRCPVCKPTKES